ncbi:hypothetical protein HK096_005731 [Nowakowskiella sp. JEL0078]|nr:hypothetical protein HK096_005731 [Nowakowskiella sp. JEL0078]
MRMIRSRFTHCFKSQLPDIDLTQSISISALVRIHVDYCRLEGNLLEHGPELSAVFLLTLFPQTPISLYFALAQWSTGQGITLPIESALCIIYFCFLLTESVVGYYTVQKITKTQAALFMLRLEDLEDNSDLVETIGDNIKYKNMENDDVNLCEAQGFRDESPTLRPQFVVKHDGFLAQAAEK